MGKKFKYISDEALNASTYIDDICPVCNKQTDLYPLYIDDNGDHVFTEACEYCIKTMPLSWIEPKSDEKKIATLINKKYPKGSKSQEQRFSLTVELADIYRRTPLLPRSPPDFDWPDCCGDFAEFCGVANEGGTYNDFILWGEEDYYTQNGIEALLKHEDKVLLFECNNCGKKY